MEQLVRLGAVTLNSGDVVDLSAARVTAIVGPNNSGKTRLLHEIDEFLTNRQSAAATGLSVIDGVEVVKIVDGETFERWIRANRLLETNPGNGIESIVHHGGRHELPSVLNWWQSGPPFHGAASALMRENFLSNRLSPQLACERPDFSGNPRQNMSPLQRLVEDETRLERLREALRTAFGLHLIVDGWGQQTLLRVSESETQDDFSTQSATGVASPELAARLATVVPLLMQSDGVRAFAGLLVSLFASDEALNFVDEPEAFLHPPQARLIGRYLASDPTAQQLLVSTHSSDVLLGLLEPKDVDLQVVRLSRAGGKTSARTLPASELKKVLSDPLLRFSKVLDGIFYDLVIVTEGDMDAFFYSAIGELIEKELPSRQVMYTFAGSKQRIQLLVRALRSLGVPVMAIADLDAIREQNELKAMVESFGVEYSSEMERERGIVAAALRDTPELSRKSVGDEIAKLVAADPDALVDGGFRSAVSDSMKPPAGWQAVKKSGLPAIPNGAPRAAADRLLAELQKIGVHLVPVGEVEGFVPGVGGHGPRWVTQVIADGLLENAETAKAFLKEVLSSPVPTAQSV